MRCAAVWILLLGLVGCVGAPQRGGDYRDDGPPDTVGVDLDQIPDARPTWERPRPANSRPYTVAGRTYYPLRRVRHYRERGIASWYGKKFHGRRTASGERYDMFKMTAAHRTLPLPSFLRVTNLLNGRSVIVRVNDRGPFHPNRLVDLSYAAAHRLGVLATGTAPVELELVTPETVHLTDAAPRGEGRAVAPAAHRVAPAPPRLYLQVGAFAVAENAYGLRRRLQAAGLGPVVVQRAAKGGTPLYRVRIGPLASVEEGDVLWVRVDAEGIGDAHLVVE